MKNIQVSDGSETYTAAISCEWSIDQIKSAFAEGYQSDGLNEGEVIDCIVINCNGEVVGEFDLIANGRDGVKQSSLAFPHAVEWSS
jgi:hypothetical protein